MNGQLLTVVSGYLSLVGLLALLAAVGVPCAPALRAGLVVAELLLVVQALLDCVSLLRGHRPDELATHLGYLAASVVLLPVLLGRRPGTPGGGPAAPRAARAESVVAGLAAAVTVVVSVRLHATWRA